MANLKISQLGAAAALTGAELVELVQSGVNVKSTVQAIADFATADLPAAPIGIASRFKVAEYSQNTGAIGFIGPGCTVTTVGGVAPPTIDTTASLLASIPRYRVQTAGAVGAGHMVDDIGATAEGQWRAVSGSAYGGGFVAVMTFGLSVLSADQKFFAGMRSLTTQPSWAASQPSAMVDMIGVGKDSGDTTLQFMTNDGSGAATKTDTGITFTSLSGKVIEVTVSCPQGGTPVSVTVRVIDSAVSATLAMTTNLPTVDVQLRRVMWIHEGATPSLRLEFIRSFVSFNFFA